MRLDEPAADLPIALALASNLLDKCNNPQAVAFGEIGLAGEIRTVGSLRQRIGESYRLGFTMCIVPKAALKSLDVSDMPGLKLMGAANLAEAISFI